MNKVLLTGVSSGIGLKLAQLLLEVPFDVLGISRKKPPVSLINNKNFKHFALDLSTEASPKTLCNYLQNQQFFPDIIFLNAAVYDHQNTSIYSPDFLQYATYINFINILAFVTSLPSILPADSKVQLIYISSIMANLPDHKNFIYAATKAGTSSGLESLRLDPVFSRFEFKIVYLGPVNTDFEKNNERKKKPSKFYNPKTALEAANSLFLVIHKSGLDFYFPYYVKWLVLFLNVLPSALRNYLLKKLRG